MMANTMLVLWMVLLGAHHPCIALLFYERSLSNQFDIDTSANALRFSGNRSVVDYFKLLELDDNHLLIGARDVVYNISMDDFTVQRSIEWPSSKGEVEDCLMKGKPKEACHNFVRILAKDNHGGVLVCGTNAYNPKCRQYVGDKYGEYVQGIQFSGLGLCGYDPTFNSTFIRDGDFVYAGTVSDFTGADPLIHRRNVSREVDLGIRTERNDAKFLNDPQFAGSFDDNDHVYLWFREQAVEYENCGRAIYSRVARLCKSDRGGARPYHNEWTSFLKARLNCSLPGDYPFYFDQIEAISERIIGNYMNSQEQTSLVYGVFTSPIQGVQASAVCAFDMRHITDVFSNSAFRSQTSPNYSWLAVRADQVPKPRPGQCVADSRSLSEESLAFARANHLMADSVGNFFDAPLIVHAGHNIDRFTKIVVDAQVKALDNRRYDVLFIGTDRGHVYKLVNIAGAGARTTTSEAAIHVASLLVLDEPIRNMMLYRGKSKSTDTDLTQLIVVGDQQVQRIPIHHCSRADTCVDCVALRDPHCAWHRLKMSCVAVDLYPHPQTQHLLQDVATGRSLSCTNIMSETRKLVKDGGDVLVADSPIPADGGNEMIDGERRRDNCSCKDVVGKMRGAVDCSTQGGANPIAQTRTIAYDASSVRLFAIPIAIASVISLIVGFIVGYLCSFCHAGCRFGTTAKKLPQSPLPPPPMMMHRPFNGASPPMIVAQRQHSKTSTASNLINAYEVSPKFANNHHDRPPPIDPSILLDIGASPRTDTLFMHNNWATSTLPKDYRVKTMYL